MQQSQCIISIPDMCTLSTYYSWQDKMEYMFYGG